MSDQLPVADDPPGALWHGMDAALTICDAPTDAIRDAILAPLAAFNAEQGYPADPLPIAITLTDDDGAVVGGLWGKTVYGWLFVDYLVVPAALRDQNLGAKLMGTAERIAVEREADGDGGADRRRARMCRGVADHLHLPGAGLLREARL